VKCLYRRFPIREDVLEFDTFSGISLLGICWFGFILECKKHAMIEEDFNFYLFLHDD